MLHFLVAIHQNRNLFSLLLNQAALTALGMDDPDREACDNNKERGNSHRPLFHSPAQAGKIVPQLENAGFEAFAAR